MQPPARKVRTLRFFFSTASLVLSVVDLSEVSCRTPVGTGGLAICFSVSLPRRTRIDQPSKPIVPPLTVPMFTRCGPARRGRPLCGFHRVYAGGALPSVSMMIAADVRPAATGSRLFSFVLRGVADRPVLPNAPGPPYDLDRYRCRLPGNSVASENDEGCARGATLQLKRSMVTRSSPRDSVGQLRHLCRAKRHDAYSHVTGRSLRKAFAAFCAATMRDGSTSISACLPRHPSPT